MISNSKPLSNINMLLQLGLINDIKKITYGRICMQDPHQGIYSMVYRSLTEEIYNKLLDYVLNDMVMFNRLRQLLMQDHHKANSSSKEALDNIAKKADKSGIDLSTLIETYNEGYERNFPEHLSREQRGFNHLNYFLAQTSKQKREAENKPEKSAAFRALQEAMKQTSEEQ